MALDRYSKKDSLVFGWVLIPYVVGLNLILFGTCLVSSFWPFVFAFLFGIVYLSLAYLVFGIVATRIRKRFPAAGDLFKRISIMLPAFYLMNIGLANGIIVLFQELKIVSCPVLPDRLWWCVLYGCIMSTAITFLNEGVANFEIWRASLSETERLRNIYQRSRLIGLKGQINPHFLFNCFNTLSGLIDEDEEKAEKFLEEMAKVHRYLLRRDDEMFVPLEDEMKFTLSYLYLIKQRFGSGIEIHVNSPDQESEFFLPPLSMQVVLENIIYTNAISKQNPLTISIYATDQHLEVQHSVHEKTIVENLGTDEGLDNLVNKYLLLKAGDVEIWENRKERVIKLPLIKEMEEQE